jgi:hypothetical protein
MTHEPTRASLEADFPGWEVFQGLDRRRHARLKGAETPVMVHGDDLVDLREEIIRANSHIEEAQWQNRQRGGWHVVRNGQEGATL